MSEQKGKLLLLKIGDGTSNEGFNAVGGLRATSITFNEETVDITSKDSPDQFRELLRAGVKTIAASGAGVFTDAASEASVKTSFFGSTIDNWQIIIPDFGTFTGAFILTSLEYAGEHAGEITYSMTIESAGSITWAAAQ